MCGQNFYQGLAPLRLQVKAIAGKAFVDGGNIHSMVVTVAEVYPGAPAMPVEQLVCRKPPRGHRGWTMLRSVKG